MTTARSIRFARFAATLAFFLTASARADFVIHHWEDHYESLHSISLQGDFLHYATSENYDSTGAATDAPNSDSYKRFELDATLQYGLFEHLSLFGRLTWADIESDNSIAQNSNSGLADQSVGATYRVHNGPLAVDLQAQLDFPLYANGANDETRTPYLGDGSIDTSVGAFATIPLHESATRATSFTGGLGYMFRSNHDSDELPWTLAAETHPLASGFTARLALYGMISMNQDDTTYLPKPSGFATGAGGSLITDAINPQLLTLRGEAGYQFRKNLGVYVAYEQSVWGENAPDGQLAEAGLRFTWGPSERAASETPDFTASSEYSLQARVSKVNDRLNLVKIDKGSSEGIEIGQLFDLFPAQTVSRDGHAAEAVARAQVTGVKSEETALTVIEYFKEQYINEGFIAKRLRP